VLGLTIVTEQNLSIIFEIFLSIFFFGVIVMFWQGRGDLIRNQGRENIQSRRLFRYKRIVHRRTEINGDSFVIRWPPE
jgi:hypothetical protein